MDAKERARRAKKVTWVGFFVNLILSAGKIVAGIVGRSGAMLADGIHSLSDFITDMIVLVFIGVSGKASDDTHQYGHGKFETFATMLISLALLVVGGGILYSGFHKIYLSITGVVIDKPGMIALIAAVVSIVAKEVLFQYTVREGKAINSQAVVANGWHHRSDVFSSVGTMLGIAGAIYLGEEWRVLDPMASIVVSILIIKVAFDLGRPSVDELLEKALPGEVEQEITTCITAVEGVKTFHRLKTRKNGMSYVIDVHVKIDPEVSFVKSHDIATEVEKALRQRFGEATQVSVHTEPYLLKE